MDSFTGGPSRGRCGRTRREPLVYTRSEKEHEIVAKFVAEFFTRAVEGTRDEADMQAVQAILDQVSAKFSKMKYVLGLALDFVVLAQQLEEADPDFRRLEEGEGEEEIFERYPRIEARGGREANTLTLSYGGRSFGIRRIENRVVEAFHEMGRSSFPSAYVYSTGQWRKFLNLLTLSFRLSGPARRAATEALFDFGLERLGKNLFYVRPRRTRLFDHILADYRREATGENAGLTFQALIFGYISSAYQHLEIVAAGVRTGSARQKRFGDMDCYLGLDLELAVEAKDMVIDEDKFGPQLTQFCHKAREYAFHGLVFARDFAGDTRERLRAFDLVGFSEQEMVDEVRRWDWAKQERAVAGMLHYLSHVEQNPKAVHRLLEFIRERDPNHPSLDFLET